jgi:plasmid stabilization system protein ParE
MASQQKIIWRKDAFQMLLEIGEYLSEFIGEDKANQFVDDIIEKTDTLLINPSRYPPCRFKLLQKNNFRCILFKKYVIVYREENDEIRIYGVIHERRNPKVFDELVK